MKQKKNTPRKRPAVTQAPASTSDAPAVASDPTLTCATLALGDAADPFYAFGRPYARDIFLHHNPQSLKRVDALVFQCGDLRDVAFTFAEAKRKYAYATDLTFVLSDTHPEVLARNLLVLHAVAGCTEVEEPELVRRVGQLTYSLLLEPAVLTFWRDQMRSCLDATWDREAGKTRVLDDHTLRAVRHCWESWLACDWSPAKLAEERSAYFARVRPGEDHAQATLDNFMANARSVYGDEYFATDDSIRKIELEAWAFVSDGAFFVDYATVDDLVVNPTMLLAGPNRELSFSAPFGFSPLDVFHTDPNDLEGSIYRALCTYVDTLLEAFKRDRCREAWVMNPVSEWEDKPMKPNFACCVAFLAGHPLEVMEKLVAHEQIRHAPQPYPGIQQHLQVEQPLLRFNVIDTGNLMDTCGLLNLLVHASPLLATEWQKERSLIRTWSEHTHAIAASRLDYLRRVTGLPLETFPTLLGVNLFERSTDEFWATRVTRLAWSEDQVLRRGGRSCEEFTFFRLPAPTVPIALHDSPFLLNVLVQCAEELCGSDAAALRGTLVLTPNFLCVAGPHATGAILPKLLASALASGRLTWTGAAMLESAPWPDMRELWSSVHGSPRLAASAAEIFAQAQLYGFPVDANEMLKDKYLYRIEGTLDRALVAAAGAVNPLATMVLEISLGSAVHQFRSLTVTPTVEGDEQRLRIAIFVPRYIVEGSPADFHVRVRFECGLSDAAMLSSVSKTKVSVASLTKASASIAQFAIATRFLNLCPGRTLPSPDLLFPAVRAFETADKVELTLSIPRAYRPVDWVTTDAQQRVVKLVATRVLAPISYAHGLETLPVTLSDHSDHYAAGSMGLADQKAAVRALRSATSPREAAIFEAERTVPPQMATGEQEARHLRFLVSQLFQNYARGARVVELFIAESVNFDRGLLPAATLIFNRMAVLPPPNPSRAHTPVLDLCFLPNPHMAGLCMLQKQRDLASMQLFDLIAPQFLAARKNRPGAGAADSVARIMVPMNYVVPMLQMLGDAHRAAPSKAVANEVGFGAKFWAKAQPHLLRGYLLPLFSVHGTECQVPIPPASPSVADVTPVALAAEDAMMQGRVNSRDEGGEDDERIVEIA
ncbi:hypothetical protein H9P43_006103 [Blastocladiella emersonii ATCC 22665]|nr:hypothetical protein H9P43_006103 [Blastocladiella emersonii ATCC 22665]